MGLAKTLFDQMKRNYSPETIKPSDSTSEDKEVKDDIDNTSAVEANSTALSEE